MIWLTGTWFIISTNFPMWLKGDKQDPQFHYSLTQKNGQPVLLDVVSYHKKGKVKTITGYDRPNLKKELAFTWRGKGLLAIAKSEWEIKLVDEQKKWAVIWFSKTLFTPEGVDIISRKPGLDASTLMGIKTRMLQDSVLKKHAETLVTLNK